MIHFKDPKNYTTINGFTFIEVIIAMTIIGLVLTALFNLESTVFRSIIRSHAKVSRIFYIKNAFFDVKNFEKLKKDKIIKQEIKDPNTKLSYEIKKIDEKSEMKKQFKNISELKSIGIWQEMFREQEEIIISFIYIKPEKEKA